MTQFQELVSDSPRGFASSLTVRHRQTLMLTQLCEYYTETAEVALSHESHTWMEALIIMLSWTTEHLGIGQTLVDGMYLACTRTLSQSRELRLMHMHTSERTRTLFMNVLRKPLDQGLEDRLEMLKEIANAHGLRSQMHQTKTSFLRHARRWIREVLSHASGTFPDTQITPFQVYEDNTSPQPGSPLDSLSIHDLENISPIGSDNEGGKTTLTLTLTRKGNELGPNGPGLSPNPLTLALTLTLTLANQLGQTYLTHAMGSFQNREDPTRPLVRTA